LGYIKAWGFTLRHPHLIVRYTTSTGWLDGHDELLHLRDTMTLVKGVNLRLLIQLRLIEISSAM
jgi:hypothetical protein